MVRSATTVLAAVGKGVFACVLNHEDEEPLGQRDQQRGRGIDGDATAKLDYKFHLGHR